MCSSSGGDQAARAAGRCSFPESVKMRDTAGRAASDEHELQIGFASTSTTKAEKQRDAAAAVGLGKAVRASFVSTHCPLSFLLSSLPSLCSKQAEQGRPCVLQCNAFLLLEKGAGETRVCVSQHHIPFKKKPEQQPEQQAAGPPRRQGSNGSCSKGSCSKGSRREKREDQQRQDLGTAWR